MAGSDEPKKITCLTEPAFLGLSIEELKVKVKKRFVGVTYHKKNDKWIAQACDSGRSKYLGTYNTPEEAARVYDAYMVSRFGEEVKTNFPKEEVDFTKVPVLKRYKKRDGKERGTPKFDKFPFNPIFPMEQAFFVGSQKYKDPERPKNPRNAYMLFVQDQRKLLKEDKLKGVQAHMTLGETSKVFGQMWRDLDKNGKETYNDRAMEDRKRYDGESKQYMDQFKQHTTKMFFQCPPQMMFQGGPPGFQMPQHGIPLQPQHKRIKIEEDLLQKELKQSMQGMSPLQGIKGMPPLPDMKDMNSNFFIPPFFMSQMMPDNLGKLGDSGLGNLPSMKNGVKIPPRIDCGMKGIPKFSPSTSPLKPPCSFADIFGQAQSQNLANIS